MAKVRVGGAYLLFQFEGGKKLEQRGGGGGKGVEDWRHVSTLTRWRDLHADGQSECTAWGESKRRCETQPPYNVLSCYKAESPGGGGE